MQQCKCCTCTESGLKTFRDRTEATSDWSWAWLHYRYAAHAEGLWRMRRHGPVVVQCTDCVVFTVSACMRHFKRRKVHQAYRITHTITHALLYDKKYHLYFCDHSVSLCDYRWPTQRVMCSITKTMRRRESSLSPPKNTTCLKSASRVAFLLVIYFLPFMLPS